MSDSLSKFFKVVAFAEALSWAALLVGMYFKWVAKTTEAGVQIAGPIHGAIFMTYVVLCLVLWQSHNWSVRTLLIGLASAVPPFVTVWFERWAEKHGKL